MLPLRYESSAAALGPGPVVFVDGSPPPAALAGRSGDLHLSHWPGNRTPDPLRRDLSTEIAFAFLDLPEEERRRLVGRAQALVLNHFDTDGVCAAFVLTRPERAARHRALLHEVAATGDFFEAPSERAVAIDLAIRALEALGTGLPRLERALDVLGDLLEDEAAHGELWRSDLARHRAGARELAAAAFDDLVYMDFGVWTARPAVDADAPPFDPGRHAFFGDGRLDRALLLGPRPGGTTARLVLGTRSFFDVVTRSGSPRPDLEALRAELAALEPGRDGLAWRCHDPAGGSPELWFGREDLPLYADFAGRALATSRLDPLEVKRRVLDAIRATWPLPHDDDEAEEGEDIFAV